MPALIFKMRRATKKDKITPQREMVQQRRGARARARDIRRRCLPVFITLDAAPRPRVMFYSQQRWALLRRREEQRYRRKPRRAPIRH